MGAGGWHGLFSHNLFLACCLRRHPAEAQTTLEWMS